MAEDFVELAAETVNHLTEQYWDSGYDKYTKVINGKPTQNTYKPYKRNSGDPFSRSTASRPSPRSSAAADATAVGAAATAPSVRSTRRRQRNQLPSPERDPDQISSAFPRVRSLSDDLQSETSCEVLRAYERETDDPSRKPESVLSPKQLRRDSAAMTSYNDGYEQSQYASSARPRSQPPRTKYYDDDGDSDYDERTGRRYRGGSGRGWGDDRDDDRDYDRIVETTERYRGPVSAGPLVPIDRPEQTRQGSYRSGYDGAVTQYGGRRSQQDLQSSYDRRSKSRGRDDRDRSRNDRDRSYSRSRSRSREGIRGKFDHAFDTTPRGLGVGLAGAVIGGLAGREFGNSRTQKRDMIIGAIVGGLGANAAENKWHDWKEEKKDRLERDEDKWEQRWDGRSRSSVR